MLILANLQVLRSVQSSNAFQLIHFYFTDSRTKFNQEIVKGPCRRYLQGAMCLFGQNCRFSHLNSYEIEALRNAGKGLNYITATICSIKLLGHSLEYQQS